MTIIIPSAIINSIIEYPASLRSCVRRISDSDLSLPSKGRHRVVVEIAHPDEAAHLAACIRIADRHLNSLQSGIQVGNDYFTRVTVEAPTGICKVIAGAVSVIAARID